MRFAVLELRCSAVSSCWAFVEAHEVRLKWQMRERHCELPVEKAIHGPCPQMRAASSPLGRHRKKPRFLGGAQSPHPAAAGFFRSLLDFKETEEVRRAAVTEVNTRVDDRRMMDG
jgi:hypothetical protein